MTFCSHDVCPNHRDDGIYLDHDYLDTLEIPLGQPHNQIDVYTVHRCMNLYIFHYFLSVSNGGISKNESKSVN